MASNHGGKDVTDSGSSDGNNSEATVEIKIKTLDSQTYTLRVDKCVPVPALKEQIASVTGVLSDQQRLICRGKVLKDDQLLSAYHVEDGHTLHLVTRQPINTSLTSLPDHTANQDGHSVVVGTFNISEQDDGSLPDFSRIVSAVLGSFGIANAGNGSDTTELQQTISERLSQIPGLNEIRNSTGQQPEDASRTGQQLDISIESLQPPVIPDSLSTLSQYLRHLRQEFNENVRIQGNSSQFRGGQGGLHTPAALGEIIQSSRRLLIEQVAECLMQLTRQLGSQTNVTDSVSRRSIQSSALRSGALLQNLGAFLLELGRTTMTLRMGRSPTDAVVYAGPAVFISTSGPNPIMVQPLPFQPGTSFETRNIDITIHTDSVLSSTVNQREANTEERSATDPTASDVGISNSSENRPHLVPNSAAQQRPPEAPEIHEVPSGFEQLLRILFPGEENHGNDLIFQGRSSDSVDVETAVNLQEDPTVSSDGGIFVANLLHQIMPIVQGADVENGASSTMQVEENQVRAASSRKADGPSKRKKIE